MNKARVPLINALAFWLSQKELDKGEHRSECRALFKTYNLNKQAGVALLELVLLFPIILFVFWVAVDLFKVNLARAALEQESHLLATTISQQSEVSQAILDALSISITEKFSQFELFIGQVQMDATVDWLSEMGNTGRICNELFIEGTYAGELPTLPEDQDESTEPMIIVQLCQPTKSLSLFFPLMMNNVLENVSLVRVMRDSVTLTDMEEDES